jgi:predicted negative regulator of RcsB-dependent stress response
MTPLESSLQDYERLAQFKKWYKKYGNWAFVIVIAALLAIVAWQYWHHQQDKNAERASGIYAQMMTNVSSGNWETIEPAANELIKNYSATPYAKIAAFTLAQHAVKNNNLEEAAKWLRWVVGYSQQPMLSQLARLRLANVLISLNKAQEALDVVTPAEQMYPAQTSAVRAQAYLALDKKAQARTELLKAIEAMPSDSPLLAMLQMQLNDM